MRVLLVEDDQMIGESLHHAFGKAGMAVDWAHDGEEADEALVVQSYDLILLDLGLPKKSGLTVLKALRAKGIQTPVLILTAQDAIDDRVNGLDAGADDYLVKPFALKELEARVRALSRRKPLANNVTLVVGEASLDTLTKALTYKSTQENLTAKEFSIVQALMESPGIVLSRAQLEERLYAWNAEVASNAVEVHVHQLRKKFGTDLIKNIRGLGYVIGSK